MKYGNFMIGKEAVEKRGKLRDKCLDRIIKAVNRWKKSNKGVDDAEVCIIGIEEYISEMEFELATNDI